MDGPASPHAEPPDSESVGAPATAADPGLQQFLEDCEAGIRNWRPAQVDYPAELTVELGSSRSYVAAVDARTTPENPGEAIPDPSPTAEAAFVRCEVAARLSPLGDALAVDEEDWVLRRFTPTGVIRWTWTVTGVKGGAQDLELELQPAVRTEDGTILVSDSSLEVSSFITRARVAEDVVTQAGSWVERHKGALGVLLAALAAVVLAALRFGREFAVEMRQTVAAWTGTAPDQGSPAAQDGDDVESPAQEPH